MGITLNPDLRTAIRLALRARYYLFSFWMLVALVLVVLMSAQFSARQPATVALDVGLSVIRLILPLLIVLLTQELLSKEFERRYILTSLTYPRPRHHFLLMRFAGILLMVVSTLLLLGLSLLVTIWWISQGYPQATPVALGWHYLLSLSYIAIDLFVLAAMATFLAVVASTPSFVLIGTFGFMLIARSYSSIITLLHDENYLVANPQSYQESLTILAYLLPDLGALDIRMITLYGKMEFLPSDWPLLLTASTAYGITLLALAIWFLQRKRFN